ncbi:tumor necrosis factor receptor superfamily member 10B isoform X2 [Eptesicus fuscus]|uniref:tumor necrosis factor receptor superfamily member 10B isoform X2 n=1 Tax=Eptesicus fuscus TaxID=29078 RepID=UPI002403CDD5|nr:tumor necrosis factor receptor superfamily member 10B isoform X2 [Eptesicus fuscus]
MALPRRPGALTDRTWPRGVRVQIASRRAVGRAAAPKSQRGARPRPWAPRTLILVLSCLLVLVPVASATVIEPDRVLQQPAASLPGKCPKGSYLSEHSRTCIECTEGVDYNSHPNSLSSCRPCSKCPPDKVETARCTRTRDTQCRCKNGTYQDKDSPEFCLPCSPRCPDGKVKAKACGPSNDLECVDQQSGIPWWGILLICILVFLVLGVCCCRSCNLRGSGAATKSRSRGWFCFSRTPEDPEALDNAHNLAISNRDSLSSEQEQEELALVQPAGEAQHLLGRASADGSQMRRKLLVPANNENPLETLRECFYEFSKSVPFPRWEPFMRSVGLTDNDIFIAKAQALDPGDGLYQMLTSWLNTKGKAASVNTLLEGLEKLGERHAKERIEDHLVRSGKYVYEGGEAGPAVSQ